jgi:hypothetical protein
MPTFDPETVCSIFCVTFDSKRVARAAHLGHSFLLSDVRLGPPGDPLVEDNFGHPAAVPPLSSGELVGRSQANFIDQVPLQMKRYLVTGNVAQTPLGKLTRDCVYVCGINFHKSQSQPDEAMCKELSERAQDTILLILKKDAENDGRPEQVECDVQLVSERSGLMGKSEADQLREWQKAMADRVEFDIRLGPKAPGLPGKSCADAVLERLKDMSQDELNQGLEQAIAASITNYNKKAVN